MKLLLGAVVAAGLAWSAYWFLGASTKERALAAWLADREAEGWVVNVGDVTTRGFPNRFDTTLAPVELADPETGIAWTAPFFQIFALSYRPNHVIAVWPDRQTLASPFQALTLTSADLRASVVFDPGSALTLDRATIELDGLGIASSADWRAALMRGVVAVQQTETTPEAYRIGFEASGLSLPGRLREMLEDRGLASGAISALRLDATVTFDRPWDRRAIEERRPQPVRIRLEEARGTWGELDLRLAGAVDVDERGRADGEITVQATNWREMLEIAKATGAVPEGLMPLLERGLETVAGLSGDRRTIDVPLELSDGQLRLGGFIPLGPAPVLRLR